MNKIARYLQSVAATTVLLIGSTTAYGASFTSNITNNLSEQLDVLQLNGTAPEPESMLLLGIGLVLLATVARKGKSRT